MFPTSLMALVSSMKASMKVGIGRTLALAA